jgi:hypothetical protein
LFLPNVRELAAASRKRGRPRAQPELAADIPILIRNDARELRLGGLAQRWSGGECVQPQGRYKGEQQRSRDSGALHVVGRRLGRKLRRASLASGFGHEILWDEISMVGKK